MQLEVLNENKTLSFQLNLSQRFPHNCFLSPSLEMLAWSWNSWLSKLKSHCDITWEVQAYPAFPWAEMALGISDLPHLENSENYVDVTSRKPLIWKLVKSHLLTFLYIFLKELVSKQLLKKKAIGLKVTFFSLSLAKIPITINKLPYY